MNHEDHDDGLVHPHSWARGAAMPGASRAQIATAMSANPTAQPEHDEGLVHAHGWACSERGKMAG
ncbi:hypothetical protein [Sabulicella rubraurantiaca]|uniref:hypothetical protein n=1 Tax=Sabulicella rubraurantiaca TaxID=2811429 RepID=UPI001A96EE55|nr:hypothetical protein [Sabulicella rubraurantiaca]